MNRLGINFGQMTQKFFLESLIWIIEKNVPDSIQYDAYSM